MVEADQGSTHLERGLAVEIHSHHSPAENSFRTPAKRPVVGVMGGSKIQDASLPRELGAWLGTTGYDLLTGAGGGTMKAVSRAFAEVRGRKGLVIGVVPGEVHDGDPVYRTRSKNYPNPYVEVAIFTHLPTRGDLVGLASRNPVNILTSDIVIVLPGSDGTAAELELAVRFCKPTLVYPGRAGTVNGRTAAQLRRTYDKAVTVTSDFARVQKWVGETMVGLGYPGPLETA